MATTPYEWFAREGSKTIRRSLRRVVRAELGPSSDAAPTAYEALQAAASLKGLVSAATNGRFGLAVYDFETRKHLPIHVAINALVQASQEQKTRIGTIEHGDPAPSAGKTAPFFHYA